MVAKRSTDRRIFFVFQKNLISHIFFNVENRNVDQHKYLILQKQPVKIMESTFILILCLKTFELESNQERGHISTIQKI